MWSTLHSKLRFSSGKRLNSTFRASEIVIDLTNNPKTMPALDETLIFGKKTTDHLFSVDWDAKRGWHTPQITPYQPLVLDPTSSCFHYGTECFEGMKAYRTATGKVLLFRPEMNVRRLRKSAAALALPDFDGEEFLQCIRKFVDIDRRWVPNKKGYSMYIRPTMIGTHQQLGVTKPGKAKLFIVNALVGPYFPTGFKPVALYCDEARVRAWPGGVGDKKVGGNYGPGIAYTDEINKLGYQQLLWLVNENVTEVGTMNFFVLWKNKEGETELITAPLDSTILEGVTRDSILALTKEWSEFKVSERSFTIHELTEAIEQGRVIEAFGAGTACIVCPVKKIFYKGKDYEIPMKLGNSGLLTKRLLDHVLSIQYGEIQHPWSYQVDY
ncbi:unnamed protein product [Blepharisma stoltei]|uniref:Branched-chain-amino-acid aminotransferase n=1 Tax=Blepharisma stoltei TaxID=1481888 RepID=A0AAU9IPJ9_9CILI|nr:unnamed protein product [Blepharisma stoltei]